MPSATALMPQNVLSPLILGQNAFRAMCITRLAWFYRALARLLGLEDGRQRACPPHAAAQSAGASGVTPGQAKKSALLLNKQLMYKQLLQTAAKQTAHVDFSS